MVSFCFVVLFGKNETFVPEVAGVLVFDDFLNFAIPCVSSKSNGYVKQLGGYHFELYPKFAFCFPDLN